MVTMAKPATAELTGDHLKKLPSRKAYSKFDGGGSHISTFCSWLKDKETEVRNKLGDCDSDGKYANKIVGAYCDAYSNGGSSNSYGQACQFFYYWLGNILFNILNVNSPFDTVKKIYEKLKDVSTGGKNGCTIIYNDSKIDKDLFKHAKIKYDYEQDYEELMKQLNPPGKKSCTEKYNQHLTAIRDACEKVKQYCDEGGKGPHKDGQYCDQYRAGKETDANYCREDKLKILTCTEVKDTAIVSEDEDQLSPFSHGAMGDSTSSIPIVSSIVPIIGLPAVAAFFLYKYNLLPSWLSSHFRSSVGRSRERRSIGRHHFDDDTLTTIGSVDTSTTTELTVNNSTIYNGRSPLKRRTNNGRKEQRQHQQQRNNNEQRRNVHYGRI